MPHDHSHAPENDPPANEMNDISHAGAVVDKAIEYMAGQNLPPLAIASALLGGAVGMLARDLSDEAIVNVLNNAIRSVRNGEFRAAAPEAHH